MSLAARLRALAAVLDPAGDARIVADAYARGYADALDAEIVRRQAILDSIANIVYAAARPSSPEPDHSAPSSARSATAAPNVVPIRLHRAGGRVIAEDA